jgi:CRP/FNR family transcriptional regulator, cyclic AMP receptor protein
MDRAAEKLLSGIPLFAGFEHGELEGLLRIFHPVNFPAAASLVRQGQPADSAYIIESGTASVITSLPGGGEAELATLGPGSMLGETALLETGRRAATVIARTPVSGYVIERDGFRMLLAQRNRAAFTIQCRITRMLCQRLRELNAKVVAAHAPESPAPPLSGETAEAADLRRGQCSFDYRAFLPLLPIFKRFSQAELGDFLKQTEVIELKRGHILFQQDDPGAAGFVVVRGALEILRAENGRRHRIGVLGPGRLCGMLAVIESQPHSLSAAARELSVLLEIPKPAFDMLFAGNDSTTAKFQDAINRDLLQSLARTNIHLTRLISQARIRGGRQEKKRADDLQRAIGEQDVVPGLEGAEQKPVATAESTAS